MVISVLSYTFTPELQNKSSQVYKETEKNFTAEVRISFFQLRGERRDCDDIDNDDDHHM